MSALTPKADICSALAHVRFGPIADIGACHLFDHRIGELSEWRRNSTSRSSARPKPEAPGAMPRRFPNLCDQQPANPDGHLDNPGGIGPPKLLFQLGLSDFFCHPGGVLIVTAEDPGVVTTLLVPQLPFEGA